MWIVFARFICGIALHVSLSAELRQGMNLMKYAVNHPWKFEDYRVAFFSGFMQTNVVIIVELVNFIALITNETVLDIVMNFGNTDFWTPLLCDLNNLRTGRLLFACFFER